MEKLRKCLTVVAAIGLLNACGEDGVGPSDSPATVQGRVEETPPSSQSSQGSAPQQTHGSAVQSVAVVQVEADGRLTELATAHVEADGSFTVDGVPAGRRDLAVVAYGDGRIAGRVLIHEESRPGAIIVAGPIDYETTAEARTYSELKSDGGTSAGSGAELSLFLHVDHATAEAVATSQLEAGAVADAFASASATWTELYADAGAALTASARAALIAEAALQFAASRNSGVSLDVAHDAFTEAALDALLGAGIDAGATVVATAAAASTFDATLDGKSSVRGGLVTQAVRMNLRARELLAASFSTTEEASIGTAVVQALAQARLNVLLATTVGDLRAVLDASLDAATDAAADAAVELLAAHATFEIRQEVRARAESALAEARLAARLQGAVSAEAAAEAVAGYRASVHAAVEAMIAASATTSVDADVVTSLFVAACAGAYIR